MADVRSMLRSELASRNATTVSSKKRKAAQDVQSGRKRQRNETPPEEADSHSESAASKQPRKVVRFEESVVNDETESTPPSDGLHPELAEENSVEQAALIEQPAPTDAVDEDEWAAFERDVATPPPEENLTMSAFSAPASIEAQALSAEELAARAREEQSVQRGRREAELEEEKEEAARQLEEEFDEMEELEGRAKRLREKREALRRIGGVVVSDDTLLEQTTLGEGETARQGEDTGQMDDEQSNDSDDEYDDLDLWHLRSA